LAGFLVGATALGACTRSASQDAAQVVADPAMQRLLQHIPADTPYAFIGMGNKSAGSTRDFIARVYAPVQKLMPQIEAKLGTLGTLGLTPDKEALARAVIDELKGRLSADGLAELGFDIDGRFAIYGLGMLPAMRLQLRDPAALRAAIDRVQAASGVRFPTDKLGEVEYWPIADGNGKVGAAVAIVGDQLVAGMAPAALKDRVFALLLGNERPARHLGNSEGFQALLTEYDLARLSAGFVDSRVIAEAFLGEGDALNKDTLAALAPEVAARWPELGATCKQEIRSLVALSPRVVFGTEQMDADGYAGKFVVELRRDIAQELMTMRTTVPGLDIESTRGAVFALGAGFDVERALNFALARATAIQAAPYRCPALADINKGADDVITEIKGAEPEVWKLRGFATVVDDIKLAGMVPTEIRGFMSFAYTDTKTLVNKLGPLIKQPLADDGTVTALPDGTIPFLNNMHYGMQPGRGGVVAIGNDSQARAASLLRFSPPADPPLLVVVYDMGRLGEIMKQVLDSLGTQKEDMAIVTDFYQAMGAITYDARASERGVEIHTQMGMK